MLFSSFEEIRKKYGKPIIITRGYSCTKHHLYIFLRKIKQKYPFLSEEKILEIIKNKGLTPYSVHIFGLALDLLPPEKDTQKVVGIAQRVKPSVRVGWKSYRKNVRPHVHIDRGFKIMPRYSRHLREGAEW